LLLVAILLTLLAILWRLQTPPRPDTRLMGLAVRATLYALPTATPQRIVVTQIVVVTATPPPTFTPTFTPTVTPTVTPMPTPTLEPVSAIVATPAAPDPTALPAPVAAAASAVEAAPVEEIAPVENAIDAAGVCPVASAQQYTAIPVAGGGLAHPAELHADLNLALRGYQPAPGAAALFDKDGPIDSDPPQLAGVLAGSALSFGQSFQVFDWDWACAAHGCRGQPLAQPEVSLIALQVQPGAPLSIPRRAPQIYEGGFKALVLYAEATRLTLGYTREDSVANGYTVHIENFCVDPALLALYQASAAAGRAALPALREGESIGVAASGEVLVAVRDRGAFLDPRSRLDWWQ
jgi:hypothetical protein